MRFKRNKEPETILPITPLIDIVFLLLIFFMLTSRFHVASGVPIRLPTITQHAYEGETREIAVSIDRSGNIYLEKEKLNLNKLKDKIKDLLEDNQMAQLILQADRETPHGIVVQVMDLAKSAGVSSIVIAAQWDPYQEER
jgi:biopolymer transport protein ExbD